VTIENDEIAWDGGTVSAVWHHPSGGSDYLLLGHGAGGTLHTPQLKQYAEAICARGLGAVRFNFPYAEAKRKAPDKQDKLEACYRAVAAVVRARAARLFLGGRSMGGRIASHIVAAGEKADGLVFLAYPLHPPGKPERLRDAHLNDIHVPMLFLQGTRDTFARPDLFERVTRSLPTATVHRIENGDHGHKVPGRTAQDVNDELVDATMEWLATI
jgi:predicted alpha/beta-hydrolase family hydrolase